MMIWSSLLAFVLLAFSVFLSIAKPQFGRTLDKSPDKPFPSAPDAVFRESFSDAGSVSEQVEYGESTIQLHRLRLCLKMSSKHLSFKGDDKYERFNTPWNLRIPKAFPIGYFVPKSASDVARMVFCGNRHNIRVMPNSGGHSYEGIGWGDNNTLIIDFRDMKSISVAGSGDEAYALVQPGANVAMLNSYLWEHGGFGYSTGNCYTVGIGGHAIGGGVGFFSGQYGHALDSVLEVEVVTADGEIRVANKNKNADLYWAMRGSGPGYIGIVTQFKLRPIQAADIKITWVRIMYPVKEFARAYIAIQEFTKWTLANSPNTLTGFYLANDKFNQPLPSVIPGMTVQVIHIQDPRKQPDDNSAVLQAIPGFFPGAMIITLVRNYIEFVGMTYYAPIYLPHPTTGEPTPVSNYIKFTGSKTLPTEQELLPFMKKIGKDNAVPRYFKAKSFYIKRFFTLKEMEMVGEVISRIPDKGVWVLLNTETGAIKDHKSDDTAFVHRDNLYQILIQYEGSDDSASINPGMKYLDELWEATRFMDSGETYQNYPDNDLVNPLNRYFGDNLSRLIEQKTKWDPRNYFLSTNSLPIKPTKLSPIVFNTGAFWKYLEKIITSISRNTGNTRLQGK